MTIYPDDGHDLKQHDKIVSRVRNGDVEAFEQIFRAYYDLLLRYAYGIVKSGDVARDLVADVFAAVWHNRSTWAPQSSVRAYFLTAVRNRAFDSIRSLSRKTVFQEQITTEDIAQFTGSAPHDPLTQLVMEDRLEQVFTAIDSMKGIRREVMLLRWREQLSISEISSSLQISEGSVSAHLSQALRILRDIIGK